MPRIGTLAPVLVEIFGMSMITYISADASAAWPSRRSPGACLMMSTSGPPRPLVISLSAPLRITSARTGEPDASIAAAKPWAIDSTETSTITTPAMPTMATPDEPRRCGMVRRFSIVTAIVCLMKLNTVRLSLYTLRSASVIFRFMAFTAGHAPAMMPSSRIIAAPPTRRGSAA